MNELMRDITMTFCDVVIRGQQVIFERSRNNWPFASCRIEIGDIFSVIIPGLNEIGSQTGSTTLAQLMMHEF